jgi:hypothetical protein
MTDLTAYLIRHGSDWLPQYPCAVLPASATRLADLLRAS